jgi:hypothetical protein
VTANGVLAHILGREADLLRRLIREAETLAQPCPPGRWRFAPDPSPEEAAALRAHAAVLRERLGIVESAGALLNAEPEPIPPRPHVEGKPRQTP